jgi:exodeoxyribonuclease V alpha subunit
VFKPYREGCAVKDKDLNLHHQLSTINYQPSTTGIVSPLDVHFARLLTRLNHGDAPELGLAAALVSSYTRQGHICLDLREMGGKRLGSDSDSFKCPTVTEWCGKLHESRVVGHPGEFKPLILDHESRLYLYRYWEYQQKLAEAIKSRIGGPPAEVRADALKDQLERLFPSAARGEVDWQKVAAFAAAWQTFCVISGGPGTGKTTTVARILALLLEQASSDKLRIALTAPTGKAAARLQEAIKNAKEQMQCPESVRQAIPETASTIHRLLGAIQGSPYFRHNADNPLPVDVVVVDEASMVDLALMSKLLQAIPLQARVILLGDKDQLASVEAGAVLGDICETGEKAFLSPDFARALQDLCGCKLDPQLLSEDPSKKSKDCIIQLQKSYRFADESGIGLLSQAVRNGDAEAAMAVIKNGTYHGVSWCEILAGSALKKATRDHLARGFAAYFHAVERLRLYPDAASSTTMQEIFDCFAHFRVLCAVREGFSGVAALNSLVEDIFEEQHHLKKGEKWYVGRPVLIRKNDYNLRLFNGDVGIFLPDIFSGTGSRVFFPSGEGKFRSFHPLRLPEHETVYAITVHKSQGSEFTNVMFVLPDRDAPVLTRELIYTAITRAKEKVSLWGPERIFQTAVSRSTRRMSGLSDALWRNSDQK